MSAADDRTLKNAHKESKHFAASKYSPKHDGLVAVPAVHMGASGEDGARHGERRGQAASVAPCRPRHAARARHPSEFSLPPSDDGNRIGGARCRRRHMDGKEMGSGKRRAWCACGLEHAACDDPAAAHVASLAHDSWRRPRWRRTLWQLLPRADRVWMSSTTQQLLLALRWALAGASHTPVQPCSTWP